MHVAMDLAVICIWRKAMMLDPIAAQARWSSRAAMEWCMSATVASCQNNGHKNSQHREFPSKRNTPLAPEWCCRFDG